MGNANLGEVGAKRTPSKYLNYCCVKVENKISFSLKSSGKMPDVQCNGRDFIKVSVTHFMNRKLECGLIGVQYNTHIVNCNSQIGVLSKAHSEVLKSCQSGLCRRSVQFDAVTFVKQM